MLTNMLNQQQHHILEETQKFVAEKLAHDRSGHDYSHIQRVVNLAQKICTTEPKVNTFVVLMSAYLHDVIDEKVVTNPQQAKTELTAFLNQQHVHQDEQNHIMDIIENMSYRKNLDSKKILTKEGQIVQDADRLDALGAIGIGRTFYYGGNKKNIMHDPAIPPRTALTESNYRHPNTVINHFYEKLFLLKDMMNTQEGARIAAQRHQLLISFVEAFEQEWNGRIH